MVLQASYGLGTLHLSTSCLEVRGLDERRPLERNELNSYRRDHRSGSSRVIEQPQWFVGHRAFNLAILEMATK